MNAEEYSKRGGKCFHEKNFNGAIADYTEAIKLEPDNPFGYCTRGMAYMQKREFDLAIADFSKAIQLEPNRFGDFYVDRGTAYIFKGNKDMAISDIEMAVKIDPKNEKYREALEEAKALSSGNSSGSKAPLSYEKANRRKNGIIILIGAGVFGIIPGAICNLLGEPVGGIIFFSLGTYVGIGIMYIKNAIVEETFNHWFYTWEITVDTWHKDGFLEAVKAFFIVFFISGVWHLIKLFFKILISPFVAIGKFITGDDYD